MNINIGFLITAYIVSQFVDWMFQWHWQAEKKSKWGKEDNKLISAVALISHSLIYAFVTTVVLHLVSVTDNTLVFTVLFISHAIIDTRIPVKWILKSKGITDEQVQGSTAYGVMAIEIDHRLHEIVLFILALIV